MLEKMDDFFAARVDGYDAHMLHDVEGCPILKGVFIIYLSR